MARIVPGILVTDLLDIQTSVGLVADLVPLVQLDMCDGVFVGNKTWPYAGRDVGFYHDILEEKDGLPYWESANYELDLMVKNAHKKFFTDWIKLGPSHLVFHLEAEDETSFLTFLENLEMFYKETISIGIAIETTTDPTRLAPFIPHIAFVQCMGIDHIGRQGEPFSDKAFDQITKVKELYPDMPITVDGGVTEDVLKELAPYSVARCVVGSALFKSFDIEATIHDFEAIIGKNVVE